jgi:hypothetical protein
MKNGRMRRPFFLKVILSADGQTQALARRFRPFSTNV